MRWSSHQSILTRRSLKRTRWIAESCAYVLACMRYALPSCSKSSFSVAVVLNSSLWSLCNTKLKQYSLSDHKDSYSSISDACVVRQRTLCSSYNSTCKSNLLSPHLAPIDGHARHTKMWYFIARPRRQLDSGLLLRLHTRGALNISLTYLLKSKLLGSGERTTRMPSRPDAWCAQRAVQRRILARSTRAARRPICEFVIVGSESRRDSPDSTKQTQNLNA